MINNILLAKLRKNIFLSFFVAFLFTLIIFSVYYYSNIRNNILADSESAFSDRRLTLEAAIARNTDFILVMKNIYDRYIDKKWTDEEISNYRQTLKDISINHQDKGYYEIPVGKRVGSHQIYNSMFCYGDGNEFSRTEISQILVMLRMQNFQYAAQKNIDSLVLSYYFTRTNSLTSIYPQISMVDILQDYDSFKKWSTHAYEVYNEFAPPKTNPKGQSFWTEPYMDRTVNGMMVSTAIPVYLDGDYNGVIGADIELTFLNRYVEKSPTLSGVTLLVSEKGYLLTSSDVKYKDEDELELFSERMSATTDIILYQQQIKNTPWKLVYLVSPNDIRDKVWANTRLFNIFIAVTLVFSIIGFLLVSKFFIKPGISAEKGLVVLNKDLEQTKVQLEQNLAELKEAQKKIVESEKLAALGVLVTGIAHELNTPLGVAITGNSVLIEDSKTMLAKFSDNKLTKQNFTQYLAKVDELSVLVDVNLKRVAALVSEFKLISASSSYYPLTKFNFKELLVKEVSVHESGYKKGCLEIKIECDDIFVKSYVDVFNLILTHLIENSLVHGFNETVDRIITISLAEVKEGYEFTFTDNGCGIPAADKNKIFEPFYTSGRAMGKGLGLYIIYNLVKEKLRGSITLKELPGTTFVITWPKHDNLNSSLKKLEGSIS